MKRMSALLIVALIVYAPLAAASTGRARAARTRQAAASHAMKLGTLAPKDSSFHKILQEMQVEWRTAPDGGASLTIYPGGAIGSEADMVRKMNVGQIDAALLTGVGLAAIDPSIDALQTMPMVYRSLEELDFVTQKLSADLRANLRRKGFIVLFWTDAGWVRFFSKTPVVTPADLKTTKLFTWAGDVKAQDIYKSGGFRPVPLETGAILQSLKTGMITAVPMPPAIAVATQVHTSASHMLELNWAPLVGALVVHERAWEKLSPETQRALAAAAGKAGARMKAQGRAESDRAVAAMRERGLKVQSVTPELEAQWRKAVEPFYKRIRGELVPASLFDRVQALLTEYRTAALSPSK